MRATSAQRSRGNTPSLSELPVATRAASRTDERDTRRPPPGRTHRHTTYVWWVSWWALWWAFSSAIGTHQSRRGRRSKPNTPQRILRRKRSWRAFGGRSASTTPRTDTAGRHPPGAMTQECDASAPARTACPRTRPKLTRPPSVVPLLRNRHMSLFCFFRGWFRGWSASAPRLVPRFGAA